MSPVLYKTNSTGRPPRVSQACVSWLIREDWVLGGGGGGKKKRERKKKGGGGGEGRKEGEGEGGGGSGGGGGGGGGGLKETGVKTDTGQCERTDVFFQY